MEFLRENADHKQKEMHNASDLFSDETTTSLHSNDDTSSISTPIRTVLSEEEESPYLPSCTQETHEDVDVLWDWNSPQSKPKASIKRRPRKKLSLQVPKVPLRRHHSGNNSQQIKQDFNKLKEEMRLLKEEIARPDNEESLILSPREEEVFKADTLSNYIEDLGVYEGIMEDDHSRKPPKCDFDDIFNDDLENQLILCSQRIEAQLENTSNKPNPSVSCNVKYSHSEQKSDINDTLENILSESTIEFDEQPTQIIDVKKIKTEKVFPRSKSENSCSQVGKFEWHRTQSFETYDATISKEMLEKIERKRKEAKAKLEAKRKLDNTVLTQMTDISDSPLQCSFEEIKKKRLQALAKLEAKRQQEIIQKNKQDALKRLEQTRKKNAVSVKHSLSKKL